MSKHAHRAINRNLYTLSESNRKNILEDEDEGYSDGEESQLSNISDFNDHQDNSYDVERLHAKNEELLGKIHQLKVKNRQLVDLNELSEKRNLKHEEKQRQLIKKLSYEQVANKQLQYEVRRLAEQLLQIRESNKTTDSKAWEISQILKKAATEKNQFILTLRKLCEILLQLQNQDDYVANASRIQEFVRKNLKSVEGTDILHYNFDMNFEVSRVSTLKEKTTALEDGIKKLRSELETQKLQKRRIVGTYNQKVAKLKEMCEILKSRVQQKEYDSHQQISHLKQIIHQKNESIQDLKDRLDQSYHRKEPVYASRKVRSHKKSYIGDGEFDQFKLNDLENEIQELEKKLIRQLRD